jgi:hypothetical protein
VRKSNQYGHQYYADCWSRNNHNLCDSRHPWWYNSGFNDSQKASFSCIGLQFHAIIGGLSAISLLLLLGHLIAVSFLPLCRSALDIRKNKEVLPQSSSTGASSSAVGISMSAIPDRKSTPATSRKYPDDDDAYGIDLERAAAAAERRARARAREISRQVRPHGAESRVGTLPMVDMLTP